MLSLKAELAELNISMGYKLMKVVMIRQSLAFTCIFYPCDYFMFEIVF